MIRFDQQHIRLSHRATVANTEPTGLFQSYVKNDLISLLVKSQLQLEII
jgi:hypothetical protein